MKNALISLMESPVKYISGWTTDIPPEPIFTPIENSCRVCQVESQPFEVALPLFWTLCEDNVVADQWYYNTNDKEIYPVPLPAPTPEAQIPNS